LEWQSRFCLSFYAGACILFFGKALSRSDDALAEAEKTRPGTSCRNFPAFLVGLEFFKTPFNFQW
jgi:hypothetical protein